MMTVFGNWGKGLDGDFCVLVTFDGGQFGGTATFTYCGGDPGQINLGPFQESKQLCVYNNTINTNMLVNLLGPCSVKP